MGTLRERADALYALLDRCLPPRARTWQERAFRAARADGEGATRAGPAFANEFAAAARWLGKADAPITEGSPGELGIVGITPPSGVPLDELGRIAMLVTAAARTSNSDLEAIVDDCYRHGDSLERRAVLRTLPLLPRPEVFVRIAADGCRTNILPVFEAIACENAYPASRFSEESFHQMVLKALFLGVSLHRVVGLEARSSAELERMATDYASERRAAGRSVPADIDRHFGAGRDAAQRSS